MQAEIMLHKTLEIQVIVFIVNFFCLTIKTEITLCCYFVLSFNIFVASKLADSNLLDREVSRSENFTEHI